MKLRCPLSPTSMAAFISPVKAQLHVQHFHAVKRISELHSPHFGRKFQRHVLSLRFSDGTGQGPSHPCKTTSSIRLQFAVNNSIHDVQSADNLHLSLVLHTQTCTLLVFLLFSNLASPSPFSANSFHGISRARNVAS